MNAQHTTEWTRCEKIAFRFFFIYFFIQAVPLDWLYYKQVFAIDWLHLRYNDIFILAHYMPQFISGQPDFVSWGIVALIAAGSTIVWTVVDRQKEYNNLYYWIRAIVRYRLAIAVIAYGFIKVFPLQSPYPSISNLNTAYGDFTRWKLFSISLGIVPGYESFLGFVEVIAGLLLLYRKTASVGAVVILLFTGNVFMSNIAYEGGEVVYSLYLIVFALFVLCWDLQRITRLLVLQKPASPDRIRPVFTKKWQVYGKRLLQLAVIFFFVLLYSFKTATGYKYDPYQLPVTKGLSNAAGIYNVTSFRINDKAIAYSKYDPWRWQDVVFEEWNTISIRLNRPVKIDSNNIEQMNLEDKDKTYELEGSAGRHYYSYTVDSVHQLLTLQNKNKYYKNEQLLLHYNRTNDSSIQVYGVNENRDSVFATLQRINKKYLLKEVERQGRSKPLKL
ncbi:DoxX family protein [Longitalea luteola]|uniref:DoxX family protein n=1 Tax=Longitalea luteola TaxID=2812563 RepID=UPI001A95C34B|nr:DoxX family protein [Longitalea luteola]